MLSRGSEQGPHCECDLDMQVYATWCLTPVSTGLSLAFSSHIIGAPYHWTLDSEISRCRKLLRLPVKEPLLTGLEHSSLLTCGLKGHSCSDTLPSLFARFQTGPTSDPSAVNIFIPLMWHVCCVVTQCWSTLLLLVRGETLIKNIGRYDHNESSSSNGIPQN